MSLASSRSLYQLAGARNMLWSRHLLACLADHGWSSQSGAKFQNQVLLAGSKGTEPTGDRGVKWYLGTPAMFLTLHPGALSNYTRVSLQHAHPLFLKPLLRSSVAFEKMGTPGMEKLRYGVEMGMWCYNGTELCAVRSGWLSRGGQSPGKEAPHSS